MTLVALTILNAVSLAVVVTTAVCLVYTAMETKASRKRLAAIQDAKDELDKARR